MRKLIALVEAFALAAVMVAAITINPQTVQTMVAASQAANASIRINYTIKVGRL